MTIRTILMDPPWRMCSGGKSSINVHYQYPLQSQQEIKETVDQWLAQYDIAEEAHVYIWVINSFKTGECRGILDGVELCEHIGFRPITLIPWVKSNVGNPTPYGMRCVEHCLFGVRNRPGRIRDVAWTGGTTANNMSTSVDYLIHPRGKHSKKPEIFYEYIEDRSHGGYLELYARNRRPNWESIGNEVDLPLADFRPRNDNLQYRLFQ
jgi:N6-adenosine-specific RNA methylase IME4